MSTSTRRFTFDDQRAFAELSGDWNPIHLDTVYARRTLAGQAVVHGIHLLLWALDVAAEEALQPTVSRITANFSRFVAVDEVVDLSIEPLATKGIRLSINGRGMIHTEILVAFGPVDQSDENLEVAGPLFDPGDEPIAAIADARTGAEGLISSAAVPTVIAAAFPAAAAWIGAERLAGFAAATRLVGMVFPGQHSLFSSLNVVLRPITEGSRAIRFKMPGPRHGLVLGRISDCGLAGTVASLMRQPPCMQPNMNECSRLVHPAAFAGSDALIIGGSRGLGELTAKLIGAGGGDVILTYARGKDEAHRVSVEINEGGGRCKVLRYRVGEDASSQLAMLASIPSHVYYFATPVIARPSGSRFFDAGHLASLQRVFVEGFWELVSALAAQRTDAVIFYPSTAYIDDRPDGFAEYAMAKAAGETMCAEINASMPSMRVFTSRLPRLATDQTVGILGIVATDAATTLLPIIRDVQAYRGA